MNLRKVMAGTLAVTMVVGSSMTVFAEDASSATGTGTAFEHVNKEVTSVTLPTASDVANVFNYYIDPERVINSAGKLADGNSATAVTANDDGVYFAHQGTTTGTDTNASVTAFSIGGITQDTDDDGDGSPDATVTVPANTTATTLTYDGTDWKDGEGNVVSGVNVTGAVPGSGDTITVSPFVAGSSSSTTTYSSSSEAVNFEGQNSVDVDVSVAATVAASAGGKDIALVADDEALATATTPALLMKLQVGTESKAITSEGATTAKATLAGKPNNFAVTVDNNNKYAYGIRTNTDTDNGGTALDAWASTTVQLVGKTNKKDVPDAMTAPTINLTWTIGKHQEAPQSYVSTTTVTPTSNSVTVTLPEGVTVSRITLLKANSSSPVTMVSGNHYTVANNTYTFTSTMVNNWKGGTLTFTYSDNKTETVAIPES